MVYDGHMIVVDEFRPLLSAEFPIEIIDKTITFNHLDVDNAVGHGRETAANMVCYPIGIVKIPKTIMTIPRDVVFVNKDALMFISTYVNRQGARGTRIEHIFYDAPNLLIAIKIITSGESNIIVCEQFFELSVCDMEFSLGDETGVYIRKSHLLEIVRAFNFYKRFCYRLDAQNRPEPPIVAGKTRLPDDYIVLIGKKLSNWSRTINAESICDDRAILCEQPIATENTRLLDG